MMRFENWPHLLAEKIAACRARQFQYGQFDCFLFVAECIQAITGIDHAAEFRGYESKDEAYQIIARYGSIHAMVTSIMARDSKPIAFAQRGDVVLAQGQSEGDETAEAVGICEGVHSWFVSPKGIIKIKTANCSAAWSVE